jgi:sarcosine oxidase subunit alpha
MNANQGSTAGDRRLPGHGEVERGGEVGLRVDGQQVQAHLGETVAGALMAASVRTFRVTFRRKLPRGLYCGMGVCYDCLVVVNGRPNTRACMTYVADGMEIELQKGWGDPPTGADRASP